ncbi:hypothetical protein KY290_010850 [Solanum tuberosum]|uniref:Uncharacterized protein n=1 Tax=Solanum tuberosum TaxID=4113 RepID=A0ABQ7W0Y5_SOLTU|nr:hypothetical protein KY290_010850 [Solanum tuberosum]
MHVLQGEWSWNKLKMTTMVVSFRVLAGRNSQKLGLDSSLGVPVNYGLKPHSDKSATCEVAGLELKKKQNSKTISTGQELRLKEMNSCTTRDKTTGRRGKQIIHGGNEGLLGKVGIATYIGENFPVPFSEDRGRSPRGWAAFKYQLRDMQAGQLGSEIFIQMKAIGRNKELGPKIAEPVQA